MKVNVTNILLILLIVIMGWQTFTKTETKQPDKKIITTPEIKGTSGIQIIEKAVPYPVYMPNNQQINVDSAWKDKYEKAVREKDSITQINLYLEAIKINDYEKILVDNDSIEIKGYAKTRGALLGYSVDYRIKSSNFEYTPEIIKQRPRLSMGVDVEAGVPMLPTIPFVLKGDVYFENQKGSGFSAGYDTQGRVWLGLRKTFTLRK